MSELPAGWSAVPLGELATLKTGPFGSSLHKSDYTVDGLPIVNPMHIVNGRIIPTQNMTITPKTAERLSEFQLRTGDVVIGRRGEMGRCAVVEPSQEGWLCGTGSLIVRAMPAVTPKYLQRFLSSPETVTRLEDASVGSTMVNLNQRVLLGLTLPLAPLAEQNLITDKLDALLTRVDACRERLQRLPLILKNFRQAILVAAMSGSLTEDWRTTNPNQADGKSVADKLRATHEVAGGHKVGNAAPPTEDVHDLTANMFPQGWELLQLRELVQPNRPITYGILKPGPDLETGVPYVRVADFPNNQLNLSNIRKTSKAIDKEFARSRLVGGEILLSIRGTVGRLVVIPSELEGANITQDSARLSIQPYVNRDYVLWYLRSDVAQTRMKKAEKGVAVRGINIGDVRALQIAIPSIEEQNEIVRRIEVLFKYADRLEAHYKAARARVEQLTPALLTKAFRGELVPQDPKDEPASVLLERIRASRATAEGAAEITRAKLRTNLVKKPKVRIIMFKRKDVEPSHLSAILKSNGPLSAEVLWSASQLDIDDFYDQLKDEEAKGLLREIVGEQRLLEAA